MKFSPAMVFSHAPGVWTCGAAALFQFKKRGLAFDAPARFFPFSLFVLHPVAFPLDDDRLAVVQHPV